MMIRHRQAINASDELKKLDRPGRKAGTLEAREQKPAIPASINRGIAEGGSSSGSSDIEYEEVTVTSTDGLFSFDILTDASLVE